MFEKKKEKRKLYHVVNAHCPRCGWFRSALEELPRYLAEKDSTDPPPLDVQCWSCAKEHREMQAELSKIGGKLAEAKGQPELDADEVVALEAIEKEHAKRLRMFKIQGLDSLGLVKQVRAQNDKEALDILVGADAEQDIERIARLLAEMKERFDKIEDILHDKGKGIFDLEKDTW